MQIRNLHPWIVSPSNARKIQEKLRPDIDPRPPARLPRLVAGADVSYDRHSPELYAAITILDLESMTVVEEAGIRAAASFPYIPGLLSFREVPPLLTLFRDLRQLPELIVCDGQGLAHPRRFGLACHLGLILDLPTIGCAKTRLIGEYREPASNRGSFTPLIHQDETVGSVLRTRTGVRPVFVSVGHRMTLEVARDTVLSLTPRYRIPETTRRAHRRVNEMRESGIRRFHRSGESEASGSLARSRRPI